MSLPTQAWAGAYRRRSRPGPRRRPHCSRRQGWAGNDLAFCNNTIYNCGWSGAAWGPSGHGAIAVDNPKAFTLLFTNNIIVSTGEPYEAQRREKPSSRATGHNLWFGAGRPPDWDEQAVNADPKLVNPAAGDFRLKPGSPAIDKGVIGQVRGPRPRQRPPAAKPARLRPGSL